MDQNQKQQGGNRQFQRHRQSNEDDDGIAYEVADDRHKSAKKRDRNQQRRVRRTHREKENRGQYSIDQRDGDLRSHYGGEAAVEIAESPRDFIAANGVKIVFYAMRPPVRVEACFEKQAPGRDDPDDTEEQQRGGGFGKISEISQVMRFLAKRVGRGLSKTFKIIER